MKDDNIPYGVHTISDIYSSTVKSSDELGNWCFHPSEPYSGNKLVAAWYVLTGRAYALKWPKPMELERSIGLQRVKR